MHTDAPTAVVVPYRFVPPQNGGHKAAYGLCQFLARIQSLHAISSADNQLDNAPFTLAPLLETASWRYISPFAMRRILRYCQQNSIRHIIAFQPFIALLLYPVCRWLGIRLSIYVQNLEYRRFRSMGKAWWPLVFAVEWLAFHLAEHLYFISPDEVEPGQQAFRIPPARCSVLSYGTPYPEQPERSTARQDIRARHDYQEDECLIIFFGPQTYQPNLEAVLRIVEHIEPVFRKVADFPYRFLICGGGLPAQYDRFRENERIEYLGYVEDIDAYVKACDLMANPVNSGGGVKTKLVEAIALGTTVVSSYTGALGVDPEVCGPKLVRVADEDHDAFALELKQAYAESHTPTPPSFYQQYYWGEIVNRV